MISTQFIKKILLCAGILFCFSVAIIGLINLTSYVLENQLILGIGLPIGLFLTFMIFLIKKSNGAELRWKMHSININNIGEFLSRIKDLGESIKIVYDHFKKQETTPIYATFTYQNRFLISTPYSPTPETDQPNKNIQVKTPFILPPVKQTPMYLNFIKLEEKATYRPDTPLNLRIKDVLEMKKENIAAVEEFVKREGLSPEEIETLRWTCRNPEKIVDDITYPISVRIIMLGLANAFTQFELFIDREFESLNISKLKRFDLSGLISKWRGLNIDVTTFKEFDRIAFMFRARSLVVHNNGIIDKDFCSKTDYNSNLYVGTPLHPAIFQWNSFNQLLNAFLQFGLQLNNALKERIQKSSTLYYKTLRKRLSQD